MKNAREVAQMHALLKEGWSKRRIANRLNISRNTLERYTAPRSAGNGQAGISRSKLEICLEWLQGQGDISDLDSEVLRARLETDNNIRVSRRTIQRAAKKLREQRQTKVTSGYQEQSLNNHQSNVEPDRDGITAWNLGPYRLTSQGSLCLANTPIQIAPNLIPILLLFVRRPNQLITREELAEELWRKDGAAERRFATVSVLIHRLRRVFAYGPLGSGFIRNIYGQGYILEAPVLALQTDGRTDSTDSLCKQTGTEPNTLSALRLQHNPFYEEVHDHWPSRDPAQLVRQEQLLRRSIDIQPWFTQAYLELCHFQILECFWGVHCTSEVLAKILIQIEVVDQLPVQPQGWWGVKAEVMSLFLWQPGTTQRLYGDWLSDSLPRGIAFYAWIRQLIFTGEAKQAIGLLEDYVQDELCQGWFLLALAHCAASNLAAAEVALQRQLSLNSTLVATRLFWAMVMAFRGRSERATSLVLQTGVLDRPCQGGQAIAAYCLARGSKKQMAHQCLDAAVESLASKPARMGAIGFWGLTALALDRHEEAIQLLRLSVRMRCYSAPFLHATPFLKPYATTPAYRWFSHRMNKVFMALPDR